MTDRHFDFFVIGGGSGGVRAARIAASHGAKVGLAEAQYLGGTCVNVGCVPKKLMAYASDFGLHMHEAEGYGWQIGNRHIDWPAFIEKKNTEISRLNGIYKKLLEMPGVEIFDGFARFIDKETIEINGEKITADKFLIATGGTPRKPNFPGAEHAIISDDAFFLPEQPKHAVIIGGGYIAVEFAHIFSGMGTEVSLLYRGDLFLRGFDHDIRTALAEEMKREEHVDLRFNCDVESIEKQDGRLIVHTTSGKEIKTDVVLAAIGREPKTENLGLDAAGIETDNKGFIPVNDQYQTSVDHIYALGDVTATMQLTPVALAEGHVLADRLFNEQKDRQVNYDNIATAVFSQPPLATVGLTEEQAKEKGHEVTIYKSHFKPLKHTLSGTEERSTMKMIVDAKTDKVLGMHMMGMDAPEIMQGFAVALNAGATKADFDRTIGIHPTAAEEFVTMRTPFS